MRREELVRLVSVGGQYLERDRCRRRFDICFVNAYTETASLNSRHYAPMPRRLSHPVRNIASDAEAIWWQEAKRGNEKWQQTKMGTPDGGGLGGVSYYASCLCGRYRIARSPRAGRLL